MANVDQSWLVLYRAALFEADRSKSAVLIEQAEKAAIARARYLFYQPQDTIEEQDLLDDVLYALRALKNSLSQQAPPPGRMKQAA
jgi:hypothetical protein